MRPSYVNKMVRKFSLSKWHVSRDLNKTVYVLRENSSSRRHSKGKCPGRNIILSMFKELSRDQCGQGVWDSGCMKENELEI
jgi:hypothetical protein